MVVLRQEAAKKIEKLPDWLESCACDKMSIDVMKFPINLMELTNAERFIFQFVNCMSSCDCNFIPLCLCYCHYLCRFLWYGGWRNKANSTFDFMENGGMLRSDSCVTSYISFLVARRRSD